MDLFVVNRHTEENESKFQTEEDLNLQRLLKKVEKRKKQRNEKKKKAQEVYEAIERTRLKRQQKREWKELQQQKINANTFSKETTENENSEKLSANINHSEQPKEKTANIEGFTIIGSENFEKKHKIKRVLPLWLSNPTIISVNLQCLDTKVAQIKELDKSLRKKLKTHGIKYFFPVQSVVIPWLLNENKNSNIIPPRDICVSAPTGSGKTLAFVLPIIQILQRHLSKKIRALVILPTQDLANQVYKTFKDYSLGTKIEVSLTTGQNSFLYEQSQLLNYNDAFGFISRVDILVCTGGRLVDHINMTPGFDLTDLEFLIIDEADRVLDSVQDDWLYHLEKHIHSKDGNTTTNNIILNLNALQKKRLPQKLLFSATLSQDPEKLQKLSLFQPKLFTSIVEYEVNDERSNSEQKHQMQHLDKFIGKYTTPKELTEKYLICSLETKPLALFKYIENEKLTKTMIFTHSLESTHRLTILLRSMLKEYRIEEISSKLQMHLRNKLIERFNNNEIDLLICTDAMARGMDLQGVKCVISYSAPRYIKTYIHRVGRTARAGEFGLAITLIPKSHLSTFNALLQQANKHNLEKIHINDEDLEQYIPIYQTALNELKQEVEKQTEDEVKKLKLERKPNLKRIRKNSSGNSRMKN